MQRLTCLTYPKGSPGVRCWYLLKAGYWRQDLFCRVLSFIECKTEIIISGKETFVFMQEK